MARSGEPGRAAPGCALVLAAGLIAAGCATTQQTAARLQLNSARIRVAEAPTRVTTPGWLVRPVSVSVVRRGGRTAFIVQAHNMTARPVTDLPISVGVRRGRRRMYLNLSSPQEFSYFSSHLPVVPAGATATWVLTVRRALPGQDRPFALIGGASTPPSPVRRRLPVITTRVLGGSAVRRGRRGRRGAPAGSVALRLDNRSGIPQYQLQVDAVARRGGRIVAAGDLTIPELDAGSDVIATLSLVGDPRHARLQAFAIPTVLQ